MIDTLLQIAKVEFQQRSHHITALPILILYLNDICNSRCLTCAIWENNERLQTTTARRCRTHCSTDPIPKSNVGDRHRFCFLEASPPCTHDSQM